MTEAGQKPVLLSREIEGFALNRIQVNSNLDERFANH